MLKAWELDQLSLGMHLWKRGRDLGETSQFIYGKERWQPSESKIHYFYQRQVIPS